MTAQETPTGPFIRAALFCERVLIERDNVKSLIRMIDQVTHTAVGPDAPETLQNFSYSFSVFISLKAGAALGRSDYVIRMVPPSGIPREVAKGSLNFPGAPNQGVDLMSNLQIVFEHEGVYWFDFELDGRVLTRMPLQILYNRIIPGSALAGPQRPA